MIRFESGAALLLQLNVLTPGSDACFINHPACPYKVRPQRGCCPDAVVSIHAPRFRGAMHLPYMHNLSRSERFNPRSPFPGSDAFMVLLSFGRVVKFQSTLPVSEERCDIERCVGVGNDKVSIHAPRFRGAMLISCNYRKYRNKKAALREPLYSRANSILRDQMAGGKSALNQSDIASANLPENTRPLPVRARL